jgi:hypothetical protein
MRARARLSDSSLGTGDDSPPRERGHLRRDGNRVRARLGPLCFSELRGTLRLPGQLHASAFRCKSPDGS